MEKKIVTDILKVRIQQAMKVLDSLYPALYEGKVPEEEAKDIPCLIESLKVLTKILIDVQYNGNAHKYMEDVYSITRKNNANEEMEED